MSSDQNSRDSIPLQYPKITLNRNVHVFNDHEEVSLKIAQMRDTTPGNFQRLAEDLFGFMAIQAMKTLNLKNANKRMPVFVLEPMLATGETILRRLERLKEIHCDEIVVLCIVAAPQGLDPVQIIHPDVEIYVASLEEGMNRHGELLPGLGKNGDHLFGTR